MGDAPRLDTAMDAALLLATLASRAGDRIDLLAYDRAPRATVKGRAAHEVLPAFVSAMAPIDPALIESDTHGLASTALRMARHQSLLVLLTGLEASPVENGLLPVLPLLTQRHTVLVASIADPRIAEMAGARGDIDSVYEAAAAARTQLERKQTADRLRRHGVIVVDALPNELAPALADAYLTLKSTGRL